MVELRAMGLLADGTLCRLGCSPIGLLADGDTLRADGNRHRWGCSRESSQGNHSVEVMPRGLNRRGFVPRVWIRERRAEGAELEGPRGPSRGDRAKKGLAEKGRAEGAELRTPS